MLALADNDDDDSCPPLVDDDLPSSTDPQSPDRPLDGSLLGDEEFLANWSKVIAAAEMWNNHALWISKSTCRPLFMDVFKAITEYLIVRCNATNAAGSIQVDKKAAMEKIRVFGYQAKEYTEGAHTTSYFKTICKNLTAFLCAERSRVQHLIVMANQRNKGTLKTPKEVRCNPDVLDLACPDVDCYRVAGRLSPEELANLAEAIRQLGSVHLDQWCKHLGIGLEIGRNQTILPIMDQVCSTMPVLAVKMKHSKSDVVLFDAHNCPPEFINTTMSAGSHALSGAGGEAGGMGAEPDFAHKMEMHLDAMIIACEEVGKAEFIDQLPHPCAEARVPTNSNPTSLVKYPDLLTHIRGMLKDHGVTAAHARRRSDEACTIGVACEVLSDMLFDRFGDDVSPSTVLRMYYTTREDDFRTAEQGGRYNYIPVSSNRNRNSQFTATHARGPFLISRARDCFELGADIALKKGRNKV